MYQRACSGPNVFSHVRFPAEVGVHPLRFTEKSSSIWTTTTGPRITVGLSTVPLRNLVPRHNHHRNGKLVSSEEAYSFRLSRLGRPTQELGPLTRVNVPTTSKTLSHSGVFCLVHGRRSPASDGAQCPLFCFFYSDKATCNPQVYSDSAHNGCYSMLGPAEWCTHGRYGLSPPCPCITSLGLRASFGRQHHQQEDPSTCTK